MTWYKVPIKYCIEVINTYNKTTISKNDNRFSKYLLDDVEIYYGFHNGDIKTKKVTVIISTIRDTDSFLVVTNDYSYTEDNYLLDHTLNLFSKYMEQFYNCYIKSDRYKNGLDIGVFIKETVGLYFEYPWNLLSYKQLRIHKLNKLYGV